MTDTATDILVKNEYSDFAIIHMLSHGALSHFLTSSPCSLQIWNISRTRRSALGSCTKEEHQPQLKRGGSAFIASLGWKKCVVHFILPVCLQRNVEPGRMGIEKIALSLIGLEAES